MPAWSIPTKRRRPLPEKSSIIEITELVQRSYPGEEWLRQMVLLTLQAEGRELPGILSLVLCGDAEMIELNRRFFAKEGSTDVISFSLGDEWDDNWGEIYINLERCEEQAAQYGVTREEELARLVSHGLLHLFGYEDTTSTDRGDMKIREDACLTAARAQGLIPPRP